MINKTLLLGTLADFPQMRTLDGGSTIARFTIAVMRVWTDSKTRQRREETDLIPCEAWGRAAELAAHLSRGDEVYLEGRLKLDTWQDTQTGQTRSRLVVVAELLEPVVHPTGRTVRSATPPPKVTAHPDEDPDAVEIEIPF